MKEYVINQRTIDVFQDVLNDLQKDDGCHHYASILEEVFKDMTARPVGSSDVADDVAESYTCDNNISESFGCYEDVQQMECDEERAADGARRDQTTRKEFMDAFITCRDIFVDKLKDYGPSWRIFRSQSVTDQLYIKGTRVRSLEEMNGVSAVGEGIKPEFCALVNYGIIALIQTELGYSDNYDMSADEAMTYYDKYMKIAFDLMVKKNHDYHEAWRSMRICSYTDFILVKLARIKQIESNDFDSGKSEGVDSNYLDIINYSIFALIKLIEEELIEEEAPRQTK